ncbi:hypothetical protein RJ640_020065 [Escallonia rubra]|uniref:Exocyst complex component SEC5 n=1 Tax=Escallonia rubra TaxID=112253 RepID=A0AA88UE80_9ASTE|nr:hypothetical protein RJ640_020065 [Escallonia rubra]
MSSGSDDLDEDELLQIALKEQAQRDLNYQKSSQASSRPAKPVANYVQPPAQPAKSKNPNAVQMQQRSNNNNQQQRRAAAAVEEDDDSEVEMLSISSGDEDSSKDRGFGSRNRVVRGSARDDDRAWDGEEPDCWKRVDETELGRRVREMRETRAVPVAPKFERKPSTIRKGLNNLQSFPRDIESKLRRIEEDPEGTGTSHLFTCIQGVTSLANRACGPLFERQAQAEKIRSVQGMLQRFRTLFNLPSAIRASIGKGEYDLVVREYRKAKSIVLPSHLENIVRLLLDLEPESDPIWHYLSIQSSQVSTESNINSIASKTEDKLGDGKYSSHSLDEVAGMVRSTISAYESKVHSTFNDLEESNILCPYMSDAIEEISKACQAFEAKESAPPVAGYLLKAERGKEEEDSDVQDLIVSFSGLEEKVLAQYTIAKVFAGCKPLLDKTLGILVEGLIDTFLSLFHENKAKDLRSLDANGFCQLMLELEYFETILNPYFTPDASESLKSLQGVLLEKATESVTETIETPTHHRRPTRGSDDVLADDRQHGMSVSPDDLIALAQQYSAELLQAELERTRLNTACFAESIPLDSVPESAKAAYASFRGSMDSPSRNFRGSQSVGSPGFSRQRRR